MALAAPGEGGVASETAVRGFLDGFCDLPESMAVQRAAGAIATSLNGWIYGQSHRDVALAGMGCTFTALILRGHSAHILHAGDSRALSYERWGAVAAHHRSCQKSAIRGLS